MILYGFTVIQLKATASNNRNMTKIYGDIFRIHPKKHELEIVLKTLHGKTRQLTANLNTDIKIGDFVLVDYQRTIHKRYDHTVYSSFRATSITKVETKPRCIDQKKLKNWITEE